VLDRSASVVRQSNVTEWLNATGERDEEGKKKREREREGESETRPWEREGAIRRAAGGTGGAAARARERRSSANDGGGIAGQMVAREHRRCFRSPFVGEGFCVRERARDTFDFVEWAGSLAESRTPGGEHASSRRALERRRVFIALATSTAGRRRRTVSCHGDVRVTRAKEARYRGTGVSRFASIARDRWTLFRSDGDLSVEARRRGWRYVDFRTKLTGSLHGGRTEGHRDQREACRYHPENVISTLVTAYLFPYRISGVRARARVLWPYARRVIDFSAIVCNSRRR